MFIYGATHNIDHYKDYNVVASESNSSIYQIDLSNPAFPTDGQTIPSPGLLIGAQHNESSFDTGYLYFENQKYKLEITAPVPCVMKAL